MTYCTIGKEIIVPLAFCDLCGKICVASEQWMKRVRLQPSIRGGATTRANTLLRKHHCNACADPVRYKYEQRWKEGTN